MVLFASVALWKPSARLGSGRTAEGLVRWVIDGDTVVLQDGRHVRYIGINSPEIDSPDDQTRHLAEQARSYNIKLVGGRKVRLEYDVEPKDRYGRTLAYVWVGDRMANAQMVRAGLARARIYGAGTRHADELFRLQEAAKAEGIGIWAHNAP